MSINKKYTAFILVFFALTTISIIAFTFYEVIRFSHNFGLGKDEATYIIQSTIDFLMARGWTETILALIPVHERHVLLGMTISNLLSYGLLGTLSFKFINTFNIVLLTIAGCLLLYNYKAEPKHKLLLACIIFPLLLSPVHNQCMIQAACTGNHYFGLAFSMAALFFFSRTLNIGWLFIAAEICSVFAIFSFASGVLLPVAGMYLLYRTVPARRWQIIATHIVISTTALLIYYWRTEHVGLPIPDLHNAKEFAVLGLWLVVYTFGLIGTLVMWLYPDYPWMPLIVGACVFFLIIWLAAQQRHTISQHPFLLCGALLFFSMVLMISFGRFFSQIAPRYATYNILCLLFSILLFFKIHDDRCDLHHEPNKKNGKYYVLASMVLLHFIIALYYHLPYAYSQDQANKACTMRWKEQKTLNADTTWCHFSISEKEMRILIPEAERLGIYHVDD